MSIYNYILSLLMAWCFFGCAKEEIGPQYPSDNLLYGNKVLVLNEGNFGWGNAEISAYYPDHFKISNGLYASINSGSLGDVCQSGVRFQDEYLIVVNNSGKIAVLDTASLQLKREISGLTSPRHLNMLSSSKAYVSDLYGDAITVINPLTGQISGSITAPGWTEQMVEAGGNVYCSLPNNSSLLRIDTSNNTMLDTVYVGEHPGSLVKDQNGMLWVLCSGSSGPAQIVQLNPATNTVLRTLVFDASDSPSSLRINGVGDRLYYLNDAVYELSILSVALPVSPLINSEGRNYYGLGVHPSTNEIYVTDARDYIQPGIVFRYTQSGIFIDSADTGIIPQGIIF